MKELSNVTMVCVDTNSYGEAIAAIRKSLHQIKPAKSLFLTDIQVHNPNFPFEIVKIDKINSKEEYSHFILKKLNDYIDTKYALVIQHDGYVLDGNQWDDDFLKYDYIGAPWLYIDGRNVGNGGFSLRSKTLLSMTANDDMILPLHPEDDAICRTYRQYLEKKGDIKFAPEELADKFSYELREPIQPTFGFHGKFHEKFKPTVVVKRTGALGDCVAIEPLLRYYFDSGYKVAIDMPLHIAMLFSQHHYQVFHVTQLDKRVPVTLIDLDGSYEENPKQLHLKSYYEKAGIEDGEIRNPQLNFPIDKSNKLFTNKYVIIHDDIRDQNYRNIHGIDWEEAVEFLNRIGYVVVQVGMGRHRNIEGAIQMQTLTVNLLMYVVAGAELFIGIDSGISNIASAFNVKSIIFAGSVNPEYIYPDLSNATIIHNHPCCDTPYCWHNIIGTTGQECVVDKDEPPCTQYKQEQLMSAIKKSLGIIEMKTAKA